VIRQEKDRQAVSRATSRWARSIRRPDPPVFEGPESVASRVLTPADSNRQKPRTSGSTALLVCPIRGPLDAAALAKDGITPTEEKRRIDFIYYLLRRGYPPEHIDIETVVIKRLGNAGRNQVRADVVVYAVPVVEARSLSEEERFNEALLVAEIKRDSASSRTAIGNQLEPAVRNLPRMQALGVYWDDVNRILLFKRQVERDGEILVEIDRDDLANLPRFGRGYSDSAITLPTLTPPSNLLGTLHQLANVMRSHGVNDTHLRYKETVKLLLARYVDEREASGRSDEELDLQVIRGRDDTFLNRVSAVYEKSARRYGRAKTLFTPVAGSELSEDVLRNIVRVIQGMHLSSASSEALQQVFMSFVPAVFKKELDQYFTPLTLVETMVKMAQIGPTDKVGDPGMGTADFLTVAMAEREAAGDSDMGQRILGIDKDQQAYDLAVVNMILNRDGQSGLVRADSIERAKDWIEDLDVVLCNPPFGSRTVETRPEVLRQYELGHLWEQDPDTGDWEKTGETLESQQLGILFIERSISMLAANGRLAIIVPEGYLSTASYGYLRQWLLSSVQLLSLVELPRRMFLRSNADLRANILLVRKVSKRQLQLAQNSNYRIHAGLVRKVGYKLGKGFPAMPLRDPDTGLEIMTADNTPRLDTDFTHIREGFERFSVGSDLDDDWPGARFLDVQQHPSLDMKPRRLMPRALSNVKSLEAKSHVRLGDIAEIITPDIDLSGMSATPLRLVEGQSIRAIEGTVVPHSPEPAWAVVLRKSTNIMFQLRDEDLVVGLVRPERRNIGLFLSDPSNELLVVGAPDGVAIVRRNPESDEEFPIGWIFATLRSEACRLQLWTESGGTSYGKLTSNQLAALVLPKQRKPRRLEVAAKVDAWAESIRDAEKHWTDIGSDADRMPILNSSISGLEPDETDADEEE
jgi:type I restriction enzyme M protein